jgi:D-alanyl-lipoteichoic acid acyltransferase DltB (MBOAT superfamily)
MPNLISSVFYLTAFIITVLMGYWILPNRFKNLFLLLAGYFFFASLQWRMLVLVNISIIADFIIGQKIYRANINPGNKANKKIWLIFSLTLNLVILGVFKYYNFFVDSLINLLTVVGMAPSSFYLNLFVPIGISYYTFKTISYIVDIYYNRITAATSLTEYALYVSFFPELLAGPIDRAKNLLPQFAATRKFKWAYLYDGLSLIAIGLFKKVYVADNLAATSNKLFAIVQPSFLETLIGAYIYSFQIYCDFSGYTDIARGIGKCFGFDLAINFRFPYISANPSEFWNRWHITLSTWLRDYIFSPLGGALHGLGQAYRNLLITMVLAGLWHGASWNFVLWGAFQGILLVGHRILQPILKRHGGGWRKIFNRKIRLVFKVIFTFQLVSFGWIIFTADSVSRIWNAVKSVSNWQMLDVSFLIPFLQFVIPLVALEIIQAIFSKEEIFNIPRIPATAKAIIFAIIVYLVLIQGANTESFIYAQF